MLTDTLVRDLAHGARHIPRNKLAVISVEGFGTAELRGPDGELKEHRKFTNLVTRTGDQYYGDRAAFILGSTTAITAITNATSAVVSSTAHGLGVGDIARIAGVTPAGYNGDWIITAVTANTLTIYVGTALGAGSVFGTVQGLTLPKVTGTRLGTGSTAVAKTGAGAAIVTYVSGSQHALDATYPLSSLSGSSRQIQYKVTYAAGEATANSLNEVVLTIEAPLSDVTGTAANSIARALLSPVVNKGANDSLVITWNHLLLGA